MLEQFEMETSAGRSESAEARELLLQIERQIEQSEDAEMLWVDNIQLLQERVPTDPILMTDRSLEYAAIRNAWLGIIDELERRREELRRMKADLN